MNLSMLSKIQDPVAKAIIVDLTQRLEALEQQQQPTNAIGFHVKESDKAMQTAFKNVRHHVPD